MNIRRQIKRRSLPTDTKIGWRNKKRVIRITFEEAILAEKLGISLEAYAQQLLKENA